MTWKHLVLNLVEKTLRSTNELLPSEKTNLYRHIRATCESGWDFSSRWLRDKNQLSSLYTIELIPVDLNALQ